MIEGWIILICALLGTFICGVINCDAPTLFEKLFLSLIGPVVGSVIGLAVIGLISIAA